MKAMAEIPEKKLITLKGGDVPCLEVHHVGGSTRLRVLNGAGEVLTEARLDINEACELAWALQSESYEMFTDDDDDPPPRKSIVTAPG